MYINQLSIFIENREGRMKEVLQVLKENDVNIVSLSLADTSEYGLLRLIVSKPEVGRDALRAKGFSAMLTEVLAIKISHHIGQLQELLEEICNASINIEYMYALTTGQTDASIVLKTSDLQKASTALLAKGVEIVHLEEIEGL